MRKFTVLAAAAALTAGNLAADIQIGKGLTVGGFIDMAFESVDSDANGDSSGFAYSAAEVDFMMDFGSGLSAQFDVQATESDDDQTGVFDLEQAKVMYSFGNSTITLGKFDTFIGLEGLEAPDLYQYSVGETTEQLMPTQHEGISYAYDAGMWNLAVAIVNGYAENPGNGRDGVDASDDDLSYALHLGVVPVESVSINANYAFEDTGDNEEDQNVWTIDASYSNHGWTLGAEYAHVTTEQAGADDAETDGFLVMANYMFTEQFGATVRYSEVDPEGDDNKNSEITFAASYAITPNWFGLIEYRVDTDETAGDDAETNTIALESLLTF